MEEVEEIGPSELILKPDGRPEKRKASSDAAWSCEIKGCNKTFAREADLKRHQRTAKAHAVPESKSVHSCPHCSSSFTRMDALKRHHKARHNGIAFPPNAEQNNSGDGQQTSEVAGPSSASSVGSPKTEEDTDVIGDVATLAATASVTQPLLRAFGPGSGPQGYYRQDTLNPIFIHSATFMHASLGVQANPHLGIAASAEAVPPLLHPRNWPPEPPWIQEAPDNPRRAPSPYYQPGSYYRTADGELVPPNPVIAGKCPLDDGDATKDNSTDDDAQREPLSSSIGGDAASAGSSQLMPQRTPSPISPTDRIGMNAAVERALQAMLAIDPTLGSISSIHSPDDKTGEPVNFQLPIPAFATVADNIDYTNDGDGQQELHDAVVSFTQNNSPFEADVEAEASCDESEIILDVSDSEDDIPMLRPEEILNEDPSIYSSPS